MSLSLKRAIEHGGIGTRATFAISRDSIYFYTTGPQVAGIMLEDHEVKVTRIDDAYSALCAIAGSNIRKMLQMTATVTGRSVELSTQEIDYAGARGLVTGPHLDSFINDEDDFTREQKVPLAQLRVDGMDRLALRALNESGMEGFVWAQIMREVMADHQIDKATLEVSHRQLTDGLHTSGTPVVKPVRFDFSERQEVPGSPLSFVLRTEFDDARASREGKLALKDVCGLAKSSTCFGGDAACTYDDYVFARAIGQCKSCATQSQVRDKFKVK